MKYRINACQIVWHGNGVEIVVFRQKDNEHLPRTRSYFSRYDEVSKARNFVYCATKLVSYISAIMIGQFTNKYKLPLDRN